MMINFITDKVRIRKDEDLNINPGRFGICLAREIRNELRKIGYKAFAGTEDWGWYIAIKDRKYFQWIGCANVSEIDGDNDIDVKKQIEWGVSIVNECGYIYRIVNPLIVKRQTEQLYNDVRNIIIQLYGIESIAAAQQDDAPEPASPAR
jgi:hypothetical protein